MPPKHIWKDLNELSEERLRRDVIIPLLGKTPGIEGITDVQGKMETGLDVIFFTQDDIRRTCFGMQLKKGNIGGGGTSAGTVEEIIQQLRLARKFKHPVAVGVPGSHRIEKFIVATSGNITEGARREIAETLDEMFIDFWDGHEIIRRLSKYHPDLLSGVDARTVEYLTVLIDNLDRLDALDQIQLINRRTLTDIFEEPQLRRKYAPPVAAGKSSAARGAAVAGKAAAQISDPKATTATRPLAAAVLYSERRPSVIIADQNDGKTSLLRMLAIRRARLLLSGKVGDDEGQIPVLIRARDINDAASVEKAIASVVQALGGKDIASEVEDLLTAGNLILSVDGFSELSTEDEKGRCAALVDAFLQKYKRVHVIVAGRPADFLEPVYFPKLHHYQILPFSDKQVSSLAQKWTRGLMSQGDVAKKMVGRIKEALQLPGSPIPAIIGVMVYEEEKRYITNTADAVDTYMTIRLGRYAREMGIKQEVEWSRKQDLLAEVAFEMVERGVESLTRDQFVAGFDAVFKRLGEAPEGDVAVRELIDSGVLAEFDDNLCFHRTAFRDFFAAQHLFHRRSADFDEFFHRHLWEKKWGPVLMFAAGLRRHNTGLLHSLAKLVNDERARDVSPGTPSNFIYGAYLLGRLLTNSEASDATSRLEVLRTCLDAAEQSIPEYVETLRRDFGPVGELAALIGIEQTLLVTVGVPWLSLQFRELALDSSLSEEERYLIASVDASLGSEGSIDVLADLGRRLRSPRVLLVLLGLTKRLKKERRVSDDDRKRLKGIEKMALRSLKGHQDEVRELLRFKSKILELEVTRMKKLNE